MSKEDALDLFGAGDKLFLILSTMLNPSHVEK